MNLLETALAFFVSVVLVSGLGLAFIAFIAAALEIDDDDE